MAQTLHDHVVSAKGIIFDLFHTLTSRESERSAWPFTYQLLGVSREAWEHQLFENSRFRLAGIERDHKTIISRMARAINPTIRDDVISYAVSNRSNRFSKALSDIPKENILLLQSLRRHSVNLGLVSNADCGEVASWASSPLAILFDSTVFSCHVGCVKPEPEIFFHSLSELALRPQDCLFVGDGGSGELFAARSLGFHTVMVTGIIRELWPDIIQDRAMDADFVIEFPSELLPMKWIDEELENRKL